MLQLYNTLTGQKEDFKPLKDKKVGMYVCGPTVYDYDHVGHARTYLAFDLLNRFLRFQGYDVTYIQNITDVGHLINDADAGADKIQQRAAETGQSPAELINHFTDAHLNDLQALNILPADNFPKASAHIQEIIEFIEGLINKNFAYVTNQHNVYFTVARKADYGKLSHRGLTEILTGTRVEPAADKRSPADFALWKAAPVSNNDLTWESPWGRGYPGWHIECSAMSRKYLGDTFDIHGSAVEHVFPHHENEIAQSEALTDKPLAKFWVHSGMLTINGQKMSKSLHNSVQVQEALKLYSPNEIRLAFFQSHYRKPYDYTKIALEQGVALRHKLFVAYPNLGNETNQDIWQEIITALTDDLDTPRALQVWGENINQLSQADTDKLFNIFGLKFVPLKQNAAALQLSEDREAARAGKDFLTADNRKAELIQAGYEVLDQAEQTTYIPR